MSVQSTASTPPGLWSWVKNTSCSGPSASRHRRTRRWKVRRCFSLTVPGLPASRCSNSALASSSGASRSIPRAFGQSPSKGSSRVLQVCGTRRCSMALSCRKYLPAVLRDTPAFIAHMLMVDPRLRSITSLVSWLRLTTTRTRTRFPDRCQTASRPTPENHPSCG